MITLAIDPGTTESGWVLWDEETERIIEKGKHLNHDVLNRIVQGLYYDELVVEMFGNYGMGVGATVFESCVWLGRFVQKAMDSGSIAGVEENIHYITRSDVKLTLCGQVAKVNDKIIRMRIIEIYGEPKRKKADDTNPHYNDDEVRITNDMWAALAVAMTHQKQKQHLLYVQQLSDMEKKQ